MTDKRPQTIQFFLPQGKPRDVRWAAISVRIIGLFREGHYGCRGAQTVVLYSEPMP